MCFYCQDYSDTTNSYACKKCLDDFQNELIEIYAESTSKKIWENGHKIVNNCGQEGDKYAILVS